MNQNKPNRNKRNNNNNHVPFISLSSVIEKYSQISYLQRNEQNSSLIKQVLQGSLGCCLKEGEHILAWHF